MANKMIKCKTCGADIAANSKVCPSCGAKNKKPIYKRAWFIIIAVIIVIGVISGIAGGGNSSPTQSQAGTNNSVAASQSETQPITYTSYKVDTLVDDLKENALRAQNTYNGQYVELTGKFANVDASGDYFTLDPMNDDFNLTSVMFYIKGDEQLNRVMNFNKGDTVTVKGKTTEVGEVMGYSINVDSIN